MTEERRAIERLAFRCVALILVVAVIYIAAPIAWKYLSPFIIAIPIAAMLQPVIRLLESKLHIKHSLATLIPVFGLLAIVCLLLYWFLSYGITQLIDLLNNSSTVISDSVSTLRTLVNRVLASLDHIPPEEMTWLRSSADTLLARVSSTMASIASALLSQSVSIAAGIPYGLVYANFLVMGIYMVSNDYVRLRSYFPGAPGSDPRKTSNQLTFSALSGLMGFLRMQTTYGLVSLIVGAIFWSAVGQPYAFVIAMVAAMFEFLPLLGNGTLYIPWFIGALILGNTISALEAIGLYLFLLTIRRFTEPKLLSQSTGITPLESLVGMFAGLEAGGILGLIGGPVAMTVLVSFLRGHHLQPTIDDIHTITRFLKRRWYPENPSSAEPEDAASPNSKKEPEESKPAPSAPRKTPRHPPKIRA